MYCEPNNQTEAPWWVVVESSARKGSPKFYSGYATSSEANDAAAAANAEEDILFIQGHPELGIPARQSAHRIPARYTYSVIAKPAT